ncbi:MAG: MFS transporter [Bryobacteraceae bacterium]|nr:MAG: MFS transporter [Bryobacteraceae bacterium]
MNASAPALAAPETTARLRSGALALLLLSLGHFLVDLYSGSLGVLQPLIIQRLGLTLAQAGLLGGLLVFSSSVTQPLYGYLSDRFRSPLFSALGPAVAGLFILSGALAPNYPAALALMLAGGAGVSAFHPQASSWAAAGMRSHRARWMAVFISSGTLGIAAAPVFFKEFLARFGPSNLLWAAAPGVALSLVCLALIRPPLEVRPAGRSFDWPALRAVLRPLSILYWGVFFRSAVQVVFAQFLVLYLSRERGYSLHAAAYTLSTYLAAGALGGIAGGQLSAWLGPKRVIQHSFLWSAPLMAIFFLTRSPWGVACLIAGGLVLLFTIPVNVTVAQRLAPTQAGTVSALLMGFAWGAAGMIFVPFTGWLADRTSLHTALASLLVFPVLGFWLSRKLPEDLSE